MATEKFNEEVTQEAEMVDQYLTFSIDEEFFGIDILRVREIKGWGSVREVPNTPDYLKGVINLRGLMVPIIDLRLRFGVGEVEYTPTTVIIVVAIKVNDGEILVGFVVDAVSDVMDIDDDHFRKVPKFGTKIDTRYMAGMAVIDERMIILLDIDQVLQDDELQALEELDV